MDFQNKMLSSLVTFIEVGKFRHFDECHYVIMWHKLGEYKLKGSV